MFLSLSYIISVKKTFVQCPSHKMRSQFLIKMKPGFLKANDDLQIFCHSSSICSPYWPNDDGRWAGFSSILTDTTTIVYCNSDLLPEFETETVGYSNVVFFVLMSILLKFIFRDFTINLTVYCFTRPLNSLTTYAVGSAFCGNQWALS